MTNNTALKLEDGGTYIVRNGFEAKVHEIKTKSGTSIFTAAGWPGYFHSDGKHSYFRHNSPDRFSSWDLIEKVPNPSNKEVNTMTKEKKNKTIWAKQYMIYDEEEESFYEDKYKIFVTSSYQEAVERAEELAERTGRSHTVLEKIVTVGVKVTKTLEHTFYRNKM